MSNSVRVGTINGDHPVFIGVHEWLDSPPQELVAITLSANYVMESPIGYPLRPCGGSDMSSHPRRLSSGGTYRLLPPEAAALVAAGAATYEGTQT
jgi:hypothetical protein